MAFTALLHQTRFSIFFLPFLHLLLPSPFLKKGTEVEASSSPLLGYAAALTAAVAADGSPVATFIGTRAAVQVGAADADFVGTPAPLGTAADDRVAAADDSVPTYPALASLLPSSVGHPTSGAGLQPSMSSSPLPSIHVDLLGFCDCPCFCYFVGCR